MIWGRAPFLFDDELAQGPQSWQAGHMTQQEQQGFQESLEAALSWMRAAQEHLHENDNTQGPLDALEARLRETEKIHGSEHEGHVLVDKVLLASENILQAGDEKLRGDTNAKVKDLKAQWDETSTYIVHCHSRIEWVWLHWSEYLKARAEFEAWLARLCARLGADMELQLGAREKLWQADHQQVVLSDVRGQAPLLERLLDEGAALYGRTGDPSVEPGAQEALQHAYNDVRDRAQERLTLLQKMAEEHQAYVGCVHEFQTWLLGKTQELSGLLEGEGEAADRLQALQALEAGVAQEETTLRSLEGLAQAVQEHSSPAGAQQVGQEALELRQGWLRLRADLLAAAEGLRSGLDAHGRYLERQQKLSRDIARLQLLLRGLDGELEEGRGGPGNGEADRSEEVLVGHWKKYTGIRNTLMSEEPQMEHLKAQLKDLFRFSEDSSHLSDDVLAVVKEHQSVKCRATRLCSESESSLRQVIRDPLHFFSQWSEDVSQVLDASAEVTDFSHIPMLVQNIERLLKDSVHLRGRLDWLHARKDLLGPVFGSQHAEGLGTALSGAGRGHDALCLQLEQRKGQLQDMLSRTKQFGDAHELMRCTLIGLRDALAAADVLQPDILAKKSQADRLGVILKDLEDCEPQILELETLVSSSGLNRSQFDKLYAEWISLIKAVRVRLGESEDSIEEHEGFRQSLLGVENWLMVMKQTLVSFRGPTGAWSVEQRHSEAQRALGEFPENELQLHRTEAWGQRVLERTSEEGRVHVRRDMKLLRDSWMALHDLSLNLYRLLNGSTEEPSADLWRAGESSAAAPPPAGGRRPLLPSDASGTEEGSDGDAVAQSLGAWVLHSQSSAEDRSPEGAEEDGPRALRYGHEVQDGAAGGNRAHLVWANDGGSGDSLDGRRRRRSKDDLAGGGIDTERALGGAGEGLGQGGGAFTPIWKGGASLQRATPPQGSPGGAGASDLWPSNQSSSWSWGEDQGPAEHGSRRREFEAWLLQQNELLSALGTRRTTLGPKQLRIRRDKLQGLRADVGWGQELFQLLIRDGQRAGLGETAQTGTGGDEESELFEDSGLEDLRYRWMLYKSKLKEAEDLRLRLAVKDVGATTDVPVKTKRILKETPGLLHRVCRVALPLWLLLLALLLLAFLLPFMEGASSCSLTNNFARSFNVMLRYDGPPPT